MGDKTAISWCDRTMNFWVGCTNISPACNNCYAETLAKRWKLSEWGAGKPRKRTSETNWKAPLRWDRHAKREGRRERVFSLSMGDWADPEVPEQWRADMFDVIRATPNLEWLLLSKRHALVRGFLERYARDLDNIRAGFTVENDDMARIRLRELNRIKQDGFDTFVSYEPALGPVNWTHWMAPDKNPCIDWLIAGGESGPGYRAPEISWFEAARDACTLYGVPFHFKQWGGAAPGRTLVDREWLEFPT